MKTINNVRKYELIRNYEISIYLIISAIFIFTICLLATSFANAETVSTTPASGSEQVSTSTFNSTANDVASQSTASSTATTNTTTTIDAATTTATTATASTISSTTTTSSTSSTVTFVSSTSSDASNVSPAANAATNATSTTNSTTTIQTNTSSTTTASSSITNSNTLTTTTISLRVVAFDQELFNEKIIVTACPQTPSSSNYTLNGWCALEQTALLNNWQLQASWGSYGIFLQGINQYNGADGNWWGYFNNLDFGLTSLNNLTLNGNDYLLLTYGVSPLKIEIPDNNPALNTTSTINIFEFGFDSSWNPNWIISPSSTLLINTSTTFLTNGSYQLAINTTTAFQLTAQKQGFVSTIPLMINPIASPPVNASVGASNNLTTSTSASSTPAMVTMDVRQNAADKIINYLKSQQDETGKIIDGGITDWSIMSFVAIGQNPAKIKKQDNSLLEYAKNYQFTDASDINICAAYPRHYLALYTAGVPQSNDLLMQQLLTNIKTKCYGNNLYGQRGINDDIFGLFALLAAGVDQNENIIQDIIKTISNDQTSDGAFTWDGWPGADITGGAINALKYAQTKGAAIDNEIITKAKNYLKSQQLDDGGWGYFTSDALTTGWVIMGINLLNEGQSDWFKHNKNPWQILTETLNNDGYYEPTWAPGTTDWFATKHAIPALLGQSWPIEPRFSQTQSAGSGLNGSDLLNNSPTTTMTTTTIATTTAVLTTSTMASTTISTTTIFSTTSTSTAENIKSDYASTTAQLNNSNEDKKIKDNKKTITPILTASAAKITREQNATGVIDNTISIKKLTGKTKDEQESPSTTVEIADESLLKSSGRETAKKVAATSGSGALIIGLYLGWRLLKSVV